MNKVWDFSFLKSLFTADPAPFIGAPLAGEAVPA